MRPGTLLRRAAILAAWLAAVGCQESAPKRGDERAAQTKVLLLGLDGASWNVLTPMLERGVLPNLQRVIDEGVSGPMRSELPCLSIVLWTSVITGKTPEAHGIRDWSYVDPVSGEKGLMDSTKRQVPALWNITDRARQSAGFVNWWASWPAEEVDGYIVSEQFMRRKPGEALERGTFPEELSEELEDIDVRDWPWLADQLDRGALKVLADRVAGGASTREERFEQALFLYGQDFRGEQVITRLLASRPHPRLLGYLSRKIDVASHYMWEFGASERPSDEEISRLLEPLYRYEDALLGRLLETLGDEANVVILSDHGFGWETEGWGHEETAPSGVFLAMGPDFRTGARIESARLYDVMPTVLHVMGLPVGEDLEGRVLTEALVVEREPRFVESYDFLHTPGEGQGGRPSPVQERILRELEALGYVP